MNGSFKSRHPEMQYLVRELMLVRHHNLSFKVDDSQHNMLMFSEAALTFLVLERFVRIVLGPDAKDSDSLYNLLQKAVSCGLIRLPWDDQEDGIRKIVSVRNELFHGNYEQAAHKEGLVSVKEYFATTYAGTIERMYEITNRILQQIDPETGQPCSKR